MSGLLYQLFLFRSWVLAVLNRLFAFSYRKCVISSMLISLVLILLTFVQISPGNPLLPGSEVVRLIVSILICFLAILAGIFKIPSTFSLLSILSLFFLLVWSVFTALNGGEYAFDSFRRTFLALGVSVALAYSIYCIDFKSFEVYKLLKLILIFSTVVSLFGLFFYFLGSGYTSSGKGTLYQSINFLGFELSQEVHRAGWFYRISSITDNPNTLGFVTGLACLLLVEKFLSVGWRSFLSPFFLPLVIINLTTLILSYSRGSMLALAISSALLVFIHSRAKFLVYSILFIFILLLASPVWYELVGGYLDARSEQGLHGRDEIWSNALDIFKENPISGVGFGLEDEKIHEPAGIKWTMHNGYLVVLSETGIVGFVFFIWFIFFGLHRMLSSSIKSKIDIVDRHALMISLTIVVYILVRSLAETSILRFTSVNFIFLLFFALGLSLSDKVHRSSLQ